jgi:hypothetical protein
MKTTFFVLIGLLWIVIPAQAHVHCGRAAAPIQWIWQHKIFPLTGT